VNVQGECVRTFIRERLENNVAYLPTKNHFKEKWFAQASLAHGSKVAFERRERNKEAARVKEEKRKNKVGNGEVNEGGDTDFGDE
jgi:hypothetical protein